MAIEKNSRLIKANGLYRKIAGSFVDQPYSLSYLNTFSQSSQGHSKGEYRGSGDGGGNWLMNREEWTINFAHVSDFWMNGPLNWPGPINQPPPIDQQPLSDNQLKGQGTKAISLCAPTNPSFDMAQFLGELREGAPKVIGSGLLKEKTRYLKGSGSEYLNVEFGWKPIVNDVQKFARMVKHSDKVIDNYRKASDTKIRRRFIYPPAYSSWSIYGGGPCSQPDVGNTYYGEGTRTKTGESKSWFSGAFKYHIPVGGSALDKLKRHVSEADKLLGIRITPELMWNLAPWTWAADWFANTGDILHNISALGSDGLAMQYGYMMHSTNTYETASWKGNSGSTKYGGSWTRNKDMKMRLGASPYGFSLTWDGLSNRQLAIAAAIGATR